MVDGSGSTIKTGAALTALLPTTRFDSYAEILPSDFVRELDAAGYFFFHDALGPRAQQLVLDISFPVAVPKSDLAAAVLAVAEILRGMPEGGRWYLAALLDRVAPATKRRIRALNDLTTSSSGRYPVSLKKMGTAKDTAVLIPRGTE
jgi:hypothetical protein